MKLEVRLNVDIYETFRDTDAGSVQPLDVAAFCELINRTVEIDRNDILDVDVCRLEESNGRVKLVFVRYADGGEPQHYFFRYHTVVAIRQALPPAAVRWLDKVNATSLKYPLPKGKKA